MGKYKKHAIWAIVIAIIAGIVLMLRARKVAADEEVQYIPSSGRHAAAELTRCHEQPPGSVKWPFVCSRTDAARSLRA